MPFNGNNKWKSGQIRKKFLNKQTHPGRARKNRKNNSASKGWCCCGALFRRNIRQANKIYFNQQCKTYTNCKYYQNTFDDFVDTNYDFFESNNDEYSTYYNDNNTYDNYLYYDEWKATNKPKIDIIQNTEIDTLECKDLDYMIEHTKYVNSINMDNIISRKMGRNSRKAAQNPRFISTDIEISIVAGKYNQYDFVKDKLYDINSVNVWTNVPMKLINTTLQNISIKINSKHKHKHKQNTTHLHFQTPMECTDFFIPIYVTYYSSIYKHNSIPKLLQNNHLLKIIKDYLWLHRNQFSELFNVVFNRNLSTISLDLEQTLIEYIPSIDILNSVLFPFIGYSKVIYFNTNIQNMQLRDINIKQNNDKIEIINDIYKSSLHYILYKTKLKPPKLDDTNDNESEEDIGSEVCDNDEPICKLFSDSENESDSVDVPPFLKYINGYTDDDSDDISISYESINQHDNVFSNNNNNILFKQPYKFSGNSNLCDDDKERDEKWWKDVKYKRKKKRTYKINDKVIVKYNKNGNWRNGIITEINQKGLKIKYDNPIKHEKKWYNSMKLKWEYYTKTIETKFVVKRLYGSHIKLIHSNQHSYYQKKKK
eukprot:508415_1